MERGRSMRPFFIPSSGALVSALEWPLTAEGRTHAKARNLTSPMDLDLASVLFGVGIGVLGAFGTGFFKRAGEDAYVWIKKKINPTSVDQHSQQIIVHVAKEPDGLTQVGLTSSPEAKLAERIDSITFDEIRAAIQAAPPLQRDSVAERYVGLRIEWDAYFKSGSKKNGGLLRLRLTTSDKFAADTIYCEVAQDDYRELAILPAGSKIRVSGEITKASSWQVDLKNVRLHIYRK
jgi:hypothetical protein